MITEFERIDDAYERMTEDDLRKTVNFARDKAQNTTNIQKELDSISEANRALEELSGFRENQPDWEDLSSNGKARRNVDKFLQEEGLDEYSGRLDDSYKQKLNEGLEEFSGRMAKGVVAAVLRDQDWLNRRELAYDFDITEQVITDNSKDLGLIHGERVDHLEKMVGQLEERFSAFDEFDEEYEGVVQSYCEDVPGATPQDMGAFLEVEVTPEYVGRTEEDAISYFGTDREGFEQAADYIEHRKQRNALISEN